MSGTGSDGSTGELFRGILAFDNWGSESAAGCWGRWSPVPWRCSGEGGEDSAASCTARTHAVVERGSTGRDSVEEFPAFLCIPSFSNTLLRTLKFFTIFSLFPVQPLPSTWYTPSSLGTLAQICNLSGLSLKPHLLHDKLPKVVCSFCFPGTLPLNL